MLFRSAAKNGKTPTQIRELHIKTTTRYHYIPTRLAKIRVIIASVSKDVDE